jgi:hypothetical protein
MLIAGWVAKASIEMMFDIVVASSNGEFRSPSLSATDTLVSNGPQASSVRHASSCLSAAVQTMLPDGCGDAPRHRSHLGSCAERMQLEQRVDAGSVAVVNYLRI